jgi:hypothetical protein
MPERGHKRSLFQIHLSTVLIAVILAGVLIGVNFIHFPIYENSQSRPAYTFWKNGWPQSFGNGLWYENSEDQTKVQSIIKDGIKAKDAALWAATDQIAVIDKQSRISLLYNLLAGFAIVLAAIVICEVWIRRRNSRSPR